MSSWIQAKVQRLRSACNDCVHLASCFPGHVVHTHSRLPWHLPWTLLGLFSDHLVHTWLSFVISMEATVSNNKKATTHISNMDINATTDTHKNNPRGKVSFGVYGVGVRAMWKLQGHDLWKTLDVLCSQLYSTCAFLSRDLVKASEYFFLAPIQVGLQRVSEWLRVSISSLWHEEGRRGNLWGLRVVVCELQSQLKVQLTSH